MIWVRSQDKEHLYNLSNAIELYIHTKDNDCHTLKIAVANDGVSSLGTYSTKEKALDVFERIKTEIYRNVSGAYVFEMPPNHVEWENLKDYKNTRFTQEMN